MTHELNTIKPVLTTDYVCLTLQEKKEIQNLYEGNIKDDRVKTEVEMDQWRAWVMAY